MKYFGVLAAWLGFATCVSVPAAEPAAPKIDKAHLEAYVRYAEGYTAGVKFNIDDPSPSPYPGFFRVFVHLVYGANKIERSYYVTADGQHFINGAIWDLKDSPFEDTLTRLPSDGFSFGPSDAKITIVVFSDFECPFCRNLAKTIRENVPKKYPKEVRVVFEDFPLDAIHPWAHAAAEAAHCLGEQKPEAFWAFHDWIFEHQQDVNPGNLREKTLAIAKDQKLDETKAGICMDTHAAAPEIDKSLKAGQALQISQTPTVYINGRAEPGAVPWNGLDALIQLELNRPKEVPGPIARNCCEVAIPKVGRQ